MDIRFLGAAQTVTGSQHLISINGSRILLECGFFQGRRHESYERNHHLPFDARKVDAMVLSHAHIDHSGNIPNLVRSGFQGPVYCTFATGGLCSAMLQDSASILEQDVAYVNRKRQQRGEPPVQPIYTVRDAIASLKHFVHVGYDRPIVVAPGATCTFLDAGHILGSALVFLDLEERGRHVRLLFTGDLGRRGLPILRDPTPAPQADVLLIESTYGDRTHLPATEAEARLRKLIGEVCGGGGKVVIPAFAVGRTQEIVYALHRMSLEGTIPDVPIFVDSPLAVNVTEIFRQHPECYDEELREFVARDRHPNPFGFSRLHYTRDVDESKALNDRRGPMVIISASGMCEAGRVLHHLKNTIEDPRNAVLIVGWQAPDTLGRRLVDHEKVVRIFGEEYTLRARVEVIDGYSAHADRVELLDWARPILPDLRQAFVVHGDPQPAAALAGELRTAGARRVDVPEQGARFEIEV